MKPEITVEYLQEQLFKRDKGVLKSGAHSATDKEFCVLEFRNVLDDQSINDRPGLLPDLRHLNDARWSSDKVRTEAMLPLMVALWDWPTWTVAQKRIWATKVAILTVQRIVSNLPYLTEVIREKCRQAKDLTDAAAAARYADAAAAARYADAAARYAAAAARYAAAADDAAARYAADDAAARYAAAAAHYAAAAARYAADKPLQASCTLMIEAAYEMKDETR